MFHFGLARSADTMGEYLRGPSRKVKGVSSSWVKSTLRCSVEGVMSPGDTDVPGRITPPKVGSKYRACEICQLNTSCTSSPRLAYSRLVSERVTWLVLDSRSLSSKWIILLKSCPMPETYS